MAAKKPVNKAKMIVYLIVAIIGIIGIAISVSNLMSAKNEADIAEEELKKARADCYAALDEYVQTTGHMPPQGNQCG